uniref:Plexin cytoplasmic RasGAP domain-containing protein n=1 Tax=Neogobius melanostomus TaxID=47308 RepID=A0A8C6WVJ8_9GOBI
TVVLVVYKKKQTQLTTRMKSLIENLEMDIRNDIRQGFVELQTENADLLENVGTIPFLDYKHFAARIFFPEVRSSLSRLLRDQLFLTSMVHVLEEQKTFSIKDKCALASLLTVALHSDLTYLTEVMEVLLKDLMQKRGHSQLKLLLRRTESTVEKLLTNWMSICLYGFLRESVGQPLFLLVSALSQQISKGPVDCEWLLWQAQDFQPLVRNTGKEDPIIRDAVLTKTTPTNFLSKHFQSYIYTLENKVSAELF